MGLNANPTTSSGVIVKSVVAATNTAIRPVWAAMDVVTSSGSTTPAVIDMRAHAFQISSSSAPTANEKVTATTNPSTASTGA